MPDDPRLTRAREAFERRAWGEAWAQYTALDGELALDLDDLGRFASVAYLVGASHSGADIAYEVAEHRPTVLAGTIRGEVPFRIEGSVAHVVMPLMFVAASHLLTIRTPLGRKARPAVRDHGGPLIRVKRDDLRARGVEMAGDQVVDADTVIWCTGFRQRLDWIRLPILGEGGWPEETRGVTANPGLYFVGLAFQFGFTSMLLGGVGRGAEYVVEHLDARAGTPAAAAMG